MNSWASRDRELWPVSPPDSLRLIGESGEEKPWYILDHPEISCRGLKPGPSILRGIGSSGLPTERKACKLSRTSYPWESHSAYAVYDDNDWKRTGKRSSKPKTEFRAHMLEILLVERANNKIDKEAAAIANGLCLECGKSENLKSINFETT